MGGGAWGRGQCHHLGVRVPSGEGVRGGPGAHDRGGEASSPDVKAPGSLGSCATCCQMSVRTSRWLWAPSPSQRPCPVHLVEHTRN